MPDTFTKFSKLFVRSNTSTSSRERSQKVPRWSLRKEGTAYAKRRTENASWLILNRIGILLLIRDTRRGSRVAWHWCGFSELTPATPRQKARFPLQVMSLITPLYNGDTAVLYSRSHTAVEVGWGKTSQVPGANTSLTSGPTRGQYPRPPSGLQVTAAAAAAAVGWRGSSGAGQLPAHF
ncbi:hypothetical protein Pmani_036531 [Petrolisthes manimaculis]|uniref:Uncharacterized protein n=1 Tax=Petrolisthes manimaculis TaxID=1843537 RepID=A0AAE1NI67_9EUCA|nr:hypothetical protein Pmani_036531 [Petrolisthes manimaculis]